MLQHGKEVQTILGDASDNFLEEYLYSRIQFDQLIQLPYMSVFRKL